jgi:hypothetical protein
MEELQTVQKTLDDCLNTIMIDLTSHPQLMASAVTSTVQTLVGSYQSQAADSECKTCLREMMIKYLFLIKSCDVDATFESDDDQSETEISSDDELIFFDSLLKCMANSDLCVRLWTLQYLNEVNPYSTMKLRSL